MSTISSTIRPSVLLLRPFVSFHLLTDALACFLFNAPIIKEILSVYLKLDCKTVRNDAD